MVKYSGRRASRRRASRRRASKMSRKMMRGGAQMYSPAGVNDASIMSSSRMNLAQGSDYQRLHVGQHGGGMVSLASSAPVGYTGVLDQSLRASAHLGPLDASLSSIRGMSDQSGGARRSSKSMSHRASAAIKKLKNMFKKMVKRGRNMMSRKKMHGGAKGRKSMTQRATAAVQKLKNMFKKMTRRQRGGAASSLSHAADYSSPGMLLSPAMENRALMGMHTQEWKLAADPTSFAPRMA